jgi:hypothetical protein
MSISFAHPIRARVDQCPTSVLASATSSAENERLAPLCPKDNEIPEQIMNAVKVHGNVDANHHLTAMVPATIPSGPVTVLILPAPQKDEAENAWSAGIAQEWADELSDQRQDIYTLADGEPVDES